MLIWDLEVRCLLRLPGDDCHMAQHLQVASAAVIKLLMNDFFPSCSFGLNFIGRARRDLRNNCLQSLHFINEDS